MLISFESCAQNKSSETIKAGKQEAMQLSEEQWKEKLTPEQYYVLRDKGTERAFTGKFLFLPKTKERINVPDVASTYLLMI